MKQMLIKTVLILVLLEIVYLLVANLALNLPVTQTLINKARPEKFAVSWKNAWSLYPFKIHLCEISANGQSPSMQWQAHTPEASVRISILPLIRRTANIRNLVVKDVDYRQRPRPKPDKDYTSIRSFFPVIENREPEKDYDSITKAPPSKKKRWNINISNLHASGTHTIWIYHLKGVLDGDLTADIAVQTGHGPFALNGGSFDLKVHSLLMNGDREVSKNGKLKGNLSIAEYIPFENKGKKSIPFFNIDAEIYTETSSLAFLNTYMTRFQGIKVDGSGKISGNLKLKEATLQPGTDLIATARRLSVTFLAHRAEGEGSVSLKVNPETPEKADLSIKFQSLSAFPPKSSDPLFLGEGLAVSGEAAAGLFHIGKNNASATNLSVTIPSVKVPDLRTYQRYILKRVPLRLNGGHGELQAKLQLSGERIRAAMSLTSDKADVSIKEYRFSSDLAVKINANSTSLGNKGLDLSGSGIRLGNANLSMNKQKKHPPWYATLQIEKGALQFSVPETEEALGVRQFLRNFRGKEIVKHLQTGEEPIKISGKISDLNWITVFLKSPYQMAVHGSGVMEADVCIASGWFDRGTRIAIHPLDLQVEVLDYASAGDGRITLEVKKGGEHPDLSTYVELSNATLKRRGEAKAMIGDVELSLQAMAKDMDWDHPEENIALHLKIPSARVKDMSAYNQYLPEQSAIQFSGGQADLFADIMLTPESAKGIVLLNTKELLSKIDNQKISGKLRASIKLIDGNPNDMAFDISGSRVTLDEVSIAGNQKSFNQKDWRMQLDLTRGNAVWKNPTRVDIEADVAMVDTRPLAAVLSNYRGKYGWIDRVLTVEDVVGNARISLTRDRILVSKALFESDDIDVGAKGKITESERNGVIFLRYKKLKGLLKIDNEKRNFDILNVQKKFDEWAVR